MPKICTGYRVSAAKIYFYHSTKIAKARPHRVECLSRSSGSWLGIVYMIGTLFSTCAAILHVHECYL